MIGVSLCSAPSTMMMVSVRTCCCLEWETKNGIYCSTTSAYVAHAAHTAHYTLRTLHARKVTKYLNRCTEIGASFMPMAFESFGAASESVMTVLAKLVSQAAECTNIPYSVLLSYWKKRISTTLQMHNSRIIMLASSAILAQSGRRDPAFDCGVLMESVHNH